MDQNLSLSKFEKEKKVQEYLKQVKQYAKQQGFSNGISYHLILKLAHGGLKETRNGKSPLNKF